MSTRTAAGPAHTSAGPIPSLTAYEMRLLKVIAAGHSRPSASQELRRSQSSINRDAYALRGKLGASTDAHLVHIAYQRGLLDSPEKRRHGDHAGYAAHVKRGEEPCDDCHWGERDYRNARRKARREAANRNAA